MYKDILTYGGIRKPDIISQLLQALAWQVGQVVSYNELSNSISIHKETVARYIELLEKSYFIFRRSPLARNPRNEISTTRKIYFYDNGVRNAILDAFKPISQRNDIGQLCENFIISEFHKKNEYQKNFAKAWFWRSVSQTEMDYVEERNSNSYAYEIKWNEKAKFKFPKGYVEFYKPLETHKISPTSFWQFLDKKK